MGAKGPATDTRRADYRHVHDQLLAAARQMFSDGGPDAVTVSAVAEQAGVSRATVHRHLGTRERLLWAVTGQLMAEMGAGIEEPVDLAGDAGLAGGVHALIDRIVGDPAHARAALLELMGNQSSGPGTALLDRERSMIQILAGSGAARPGIDAEVLAVVNLAGLLLWSVLNQQGQVRGGADRYRAEIVRLLLHGAIDPALVPDLTLEMKHE